MDSKVLAAVAAATTTVEFRFGTKTWGQWESGRLCGKWPLRDEVAGNAGGCSAGRN